MRLAARGLLVGLLLAPAGSRAPEPAPAQSPDPQLAEFVPSERVPADSAVAFPVDI